MSRVISSDSERSTETAKVKPNAVKPVAKKTTNNSVSSAGISGFVYTVDANARSSPLKNAQLISQNFQEEIFNSVCFRNKLNNLEQKNFTCSVEDAKSLNPIISIKSTFVDRLDNKEKTTEYKISFDSNLENPQRPSIPKLGTVNEIKLLSPKNGNAWSEEELRANQGALRGTLVADINLNPRYQKSKNLYLEKYQQEAVNAGLEAYTKHDKKSITIEMPTGTGKTAVAWTLMDRYLKHLRQVGKPDGSVLFVVNNLTILKDAKKDLKKFFPGYLKLPQQKIYFTTPKSMFRLLTTLKERNEKVVHAIYDEVHHLPAEIHSASLAKLIELYPEVTVAGYSATPFRTDGKEVEKRSGEIAYSYSQLQAWRDGYLPTVHITKPSIPITKQEKNPEVYVPHGLDLGDKIIAFKDILKSYQNAKASLYNGKTLIMVRDIDSANALQKFLQKQKDLQGNKIKSAVYHSRDKGSYEIYQAWNEGSWSKKATAEQKKAGIPDVLITVDAVKEGANAKPAHLMICKRVHSFPALLQIFGRGTRIDACKTKLLVSDLADVTSRPSFSLAIMNYFKMIHKQEASKKQTYASYINLCHEILGNKGTDLDLELFTLDQNVADQLRDYVSQVPVYLARTYQHYRDFEKKPEEIDALDQHISRLLGIKNSNANKLELKQYFKDLKTDLDHDKNLFKRRVQLMRVILNGKASDDQVTHYMFTKSKTHRFIFRRFLSLLAEQSPAKSDAKGDLSKILPEFVLHDRFSLIMARKNIKILREVLCPEINEDDLFKNYLTNPQFIESLSINSQTVLQHLKQMKLAGEDQRAWFRSIEAGKASKGIVQMPGDDEQKCIRALYEVYCRIALSRQTQVSTIDPRQKIKLKDILNESPILTYTSDSKLKINDIYEAHSDFKTKLAELGLYVGSDDPLVRLHGLMATFEQINGTTRIPEIKKLLFSPEVESKMPNVSAGSLASYEAKYSKLKKKLDEYKLRLDESLHTKAENEHKEILERFVYLLGLGIVMKQVQYQGNNYQLRKDTKREVSTKQSMTRKYLLIKRVKPSAPVLLTLLDKTGGFNDYRFMLLTREKLTDFESDYKQLSEASAKEKYLKMVTELLNQLRSIGDKQIMFVLPKDFTGSTFFADLQKYIFKKSKLDILGPYDGTVAAVFDLDHSRISPFISAQQKQKFLKNIDDHKATLTLALYNNYLNQRDVYHVENLICIKSAIEKCDAEEMHSAIRLIKQNLKNKANNNERTLYVRSLSLIEAEAKKIFDASGSLTEEDLIVLGIYLAALATSAKTPNGNTWSAIVKGLVELYVKLRSASIELDAADAAELKRLIIKLASSLLTDDPREEVRMVRNFLITNFGMTDSHKTDIPDTLAAAQDLIKKLQSSTSVESLQKPAFTGPRKIFFANDPNFGKIIKVGVTNLALTYSGREIDYVRIKKNPVVHLDPKCKEFKAAPTKTKREDIYELVQTLNTELSYRPGIKKQCQVCPKCSPGMDNLNLVQYLNAAQEKLLRAEKSKEYIFEEIV